MRRWASGAAAHRPPARARHRHLCPTLRFARTRLRGHPWSDGPDVAERTETFDFDEATVTLPVPDGAEFGELDGLPDGERHLTWTAAPGAFFMISAGADVAHATAGEGARVV